MRHLFQAWAEGASRGQTDQGDADGTMSVLSVQGLSTWEQRGDTGRGGADHTARCSFAFPTAALRERTRGLLNSMEATASEAGLRGMGTCQPPSWWPECSRVAHTAGTAWLAHPGSAEVWAAQAALPPLASWVSTRGLGTRASRLHEHWGPPASPHIKRTNSIMKTNNICFFF